MSARLVEDLLNVPGDLFRVLAQRRHPHLGLPDAKIQVIAEAASPHLGAQVAPGGCAEADVGGLLLRRAEALHFPRLQDAQELALHLERQLGDFIQNEAAAVRRWHVAEGVRRAREGTPPRTEEQALRDLSGNGRAVDGREGASARSA